MSDNTKTLDANRDPITGAPGAHPLGVGAGASVGGAAGAAVGAAVGGPVGAVVGGTIGAIAGGLGGKGAAEAVNPTVEDAYWRATYTSSQPSGRGEPYETYQPAYRYGWEAQRRHEGQSFDAVEPELRHEWEMTPHAEGLSWDRAKHAMRDAWQRVERGVTGHSGSKKM
ncbi:MAG: hypothetical protein ABI587_06240 [Gemmatimonadales bacterium]